MLEVPKDSNVERLKDVGGIRREAEEVNVPSAAFSNQGERVASFVPVTKKEDVLVWVRANFVDLGNEVIDSRLADDLVGPAVLGDGEGRLVLEGVSSGLLHRSEGRDTGHLLASNDERRGHGLATSGDKEGASQVLRADGLDDLRLDVHRGEDLLQSLFLP